RHSGTLVKEEKEMEKDMVVVGVAHDRNVAKVVLVDVPDRPGVAHKIFAALAAEGINVDMIVQTTKAEKTTDLLFTVTRDDLPRTREICAELVRELGARTLVDQTHLVKVSIVGSGMMSNPGVAAKMFGALAENGINIEVISTSEIKISCLIDEAQMEQAVRAIHAAFELDRGAAEEAAG